jgi:hypothetical protein
MWSYPDSGNKTGKTVFRIGSKRQMMIGKRSVSVQTFSDRLLKQKG